MKYTSSSVLFHIGLEMKYLRSSILAFAMTLFLSDTVNNEVTIRVVLDTGAVVTASIEGPGVG